MPVSALASLHQQQQQQQQTEQKIEQVKSAIQQLQQSIVHQEHLYQLDLQQQLEQQQQQHQQQQQMNLIEASTINGGDLGSISLSSNGAAVGGDSSALKDSTTTAAIIQASISPPVSTNVSHNLLQHQQPTFQPLLAQTQPTILLPQHFQHQGNQIQFIPLQQPQPQINHHLIPSVASAHQNQLLLNPLLQQQLLIQAGQQPQQHVLPFLTHPQQQTLHHLLPTQQPQFVQLRPNLMSAGAQLTLPNLIGAQLQPQQQQQQFIINSPFYRILP